MNYEILKVGPKIKTRKCIKRMIQVRCEGVVWDQWYYGTTETIDIKEGDIIVF